MKRRIADLTKPRIPSPREDRNDDRGREQQDDEPTARGKHGEPHTRKAPEDGGRERSEPNDMPVRDRTHHEREHVRRNEKDPAASRGSRQAEGVEENDRARHDKRDDSQREQEGSSRCGPLPGC